MGRVQQQARRQQLVEELCGAAVRALTGDADLHFRAGGLYRGLRRVPLHAPHLQAHPESDDLIDYRGVTDGIALRLTHTDERLHRRLCPEEPIQRLIFELLEQLRAESLAPAHLPGMSRNLLQRFISWSHQFHQSGLTDQALGLLLYTLAQICWARVNGRAVLEETEGLIEATRGGIAPLLGRDLAALRSHRRDQEAYAGAALSIARIVNDLIGAAGPGQSAEADEPEDADDAAAFRLLLDFDDCESDGVASVTIGNGKVLADADAGYRVFTAEYDREVNAGSLVRPDLLRELRERLDERVRTQGINIHRLARRLAVLFAQPERDDWSFGEEDGYVDGRRLSQLVASPAERRLFRLQRDQPRAHCLVSFLVDCSGSMKNHIEPVAVMIDVFGRALEQVGVTMEVLGFTTGAWSGGRVQRDWMARGRPAHPGRLNELTYMVYKDADTRWRRARPTVAAMLKPDLFREGVDGEAVDWACARMRGRIESRRLLVVISDGCPMDTATNLANDEFYLDNHLKAVVARHEQQGEVEIFALGVGLDLSPYYSRCLALDLADGLSNGTFNEILELMGGRHRR